jgi:hypothetical protein
VSTGFRRLAALALAASVAGFTLDAHAASDPRLLDTRGDGVYGRLDGDWALSADAMLDFSSKTGFAPAARLAAHYFWMAGVYVAAAGPATRGLDSRFATGVELRPMFLPRFGLDLQRGPSWLDLWIDSIGLGLGAYWEHPSGADALQRGFEANLGFGVPLQRRDAGLWWVSRAGLRLPDDARPAQFTVQVGLSWHWPWLSPLTD